MDSTSTSQTSPKPRPDLVDYKKSKNDKLSLSECVKLLEGVLDREVDWDKIRLTVESWKHKVEETPIAPILYPMSSAPRDGTKILIKVNFSDYPTEFKVVSWIDKASTLRDGGGWKSSTKYETSVDFDEWCVGWMPLPVEN